MYLQDDEQPIIWRQSIQKSLPSHTVIHLFEHLINHNENPKLPFQVFACRRCNSFSFVYSVQKINCLQTIAYQASIAHAETFPPVPVMNKCSCYLTVLQI